MAVRRRYDPSPTSIDRTELDQRQNALTGARTTVEAELQASFFRRVATRRKSLWRQNTASAHPRCGPAARERDLEQAHVIHLCRGNCPFTL